MLVTESTEGTKGSCICGEVRPIICQESGHTPSVEERLTWVLLCAPVVDVPNIELTDRCRYDDAHVQIPRIMLQPDNWGLPCVEVQRRIIRCLLRIIGMNGYPRYTGRLMPRQYSQLSSLAWIQVPVSAAREAEWRSLRSLSHMSTLRAVWIQREHHVEVDGGAVVD